MKILWLNAKLGAFGGAEANVLATARALQARGWQNELLYLEKTGVAMEAWHEAFGQTWNVASEADEKHALRETSADVIWIHNWPESGFFERLRSKGVPMGRMVHDHALYCMRQYKYHPLTRKNCTRPASLACLFPCMAFLQRGSGGWPFRFDSLTRKLEEIRDNRQLDRVVVASHFMKGELLKNGFSEEKIRILAPIPDEPPDQETSAEAAAAGGAPGRILFIGQVIRGKGVDLLIRALHGLDGDWHLAIAGKGSALQKCRALISQLGLESRVTIHGHLNPMELSAQYRQAQIVVVPSAWQEPYGMVGIEAMRHARAVVAFDVGGIPEWLADNENGRLVPAGNVEALRATLRELLRNPEACRALGLCGFNKSASVFSFSKSIDNLQFMLSELAGADSRAALGGV
ncbi:MAG: glycosyltransferase family 4 protein [Terrimicrobiaceae bacterium]